MIDVAVSSSASAAQLLVSVCGDPTYSVEERCSCDLEKATLRIERISVLHGLQALDRSTVGYG